MRVALPVLLALCLTGRLALADPPPKVCVVVVGDPDEAVRAGADTLSSSIASSATLRGVADAETRSVLRGESGTAGSDLGQLRRSLRGTEADAPTLLTLAEQLGCALVLELASRPAGTMLRLYDVVHRAWQPPVEVRSVEASLVERVILPALAPVPAAATPAPVRPAPSPVAAPSPARRSFLGRAWPFLVAGVAAAAFVAVFFVLRDQGPGTTQVTVFHQGAP